jgi:lysophospholipase L1-like esterase
MYRDIRTMRHRFRLGLIAGMLAICMIAMTCRAVADDLGGVADIRAWASAPALPFPVVVSAYGSNLDWSLPGSGVFRYLGAAAGPTSGQYGQDYWVASGLYGAGATSWSIATSTDGNQITFGVSAGPADAYRVRVDGSPSPIRYLPGPGWQSDDITVRFPDRRTRNVVLEMTGYGAGFLGAATSGPGQLEKPQFAVGPRTIFLGDSWTAGNRLPIPFEGYVDRCAELLGLGDAWASGIGGTGYVATALASVNFGQRLQSDVLRWHPGTVIVAGGSNDLMASPATFHRAVGELFARIRRALPQVRLTAVGPWENSGTLPPRYTQYAGIIRAAVLTQHGAYVDTTHWITGHGSTAHPVHDGGNASRYIGPLAHPNIAGYRYIGTRLANAITTLTRSSGRAPGSRARAQARRPPRPRA